MQQKDLKSHKPIMTNLNPTPSEQQFGDISKKGDLTPTIISQDETKVPANGSK